MTEQKTKWIIVSIVVIAVIAVVTFLLWPNAAPEASSTENITGAQCDKIVDDYLKEECMTEVAIDAKNMELCERVSDKADIPGGFTDRDNCYYNYAMATSDLAACERIKDWSGTLKGSCERNLAVGG
jgi:hypothetical protein